MLELRPPIRQDPFRDNLPVAKRTDATNAEIAGMLVDYSCGIIDVVTTLEALALVWGWNGDQLLSLVGDSPTTVGQAKLQWSDGQLWLCVPLDHYCHQAREGSGPIDPALTEGGE